MGLDMYAVSVAATVAGDKQVDVKASEDGTKAKELAYWRKFNHLHGWMERLYRTKGGTCESFNCTTVRLDSADLDMLEQAAQNPATHLPATQGFFFGGDEWEPGNTESIQEFITKARAEIVEGRVVLYDSWW